MATKNTGKPTPLATLRNAGAWGTFAASSSDPAARVYRETVVKRFERSHMKPGNWESNRTHSASLKRPS